MTYEEALAALSDPRRRAILEALRDGPRSVSQIAEAQPVSRPAVSQHLKVLEKAGLVAARPVGAARHYHLCPDGLAPLRAYLDRMWDDALTAFAAEVETQMEPKSGGQISEIGHDGTTHIWGSVRVYDPSDRLSLLWHIGKPVAEATHVDVTFEPREGGTRVTLTHHGWDALGDDGPRMRDGYNTGWVHVFETCFANACKTGVDA